MKTFQKIVKFILPLLFGIGIIWFMMDKIDINAVMEVLSRGISWTWVLVSLIFALLSHIIRAVRWRMQIRTFGVNPSLHDMCISVFGNYGLNLVFPRLGEIWRCNYIAHGYGLSFSTAVGTMISERIADMVIALLLVVLAFALEHDVFLDFFAFHGNAGSNIVSLISSPWLWTGLVAVILVFFLSRHFFRQNRIYQYLSRLVHNLWEGVISIRTLKHPWLFVMWSILLWGAYYMNTYTQLFFFDFTSHLSAAAGLAVFVMGSLSLLVPVQGGLGAWHAVVIFTLTCYGIPEPEAFSFALVSWAVEQGFVLLLGVYAMIVVALKKK